LTSIPHRQCGKKKEREREREKIVLDVIIGGLDEKNKGCFP